MTADTVRGLLADKISSAVFLSEYPVSAGSALMRELTVTVGIGEEKETAGEEKETKLALTIYLPFGEEPDRAGELFTEICTVLRDNLATLSTVSRGNIRRDSGIKALVIPCFAVFSGEGECRFEINGKSFDAVSLSISEEIPRRDFYAFGEDGPVHTLAEGSVFTGEIVSVELGDVDISAAFELKVEGSVYKDCRFTKIHHGSSGLVKKACFRSGKRADA